MSFDRSVYLSVADEKIIKSIPEETPSFKILGLSLNSKFIR